MNLYKKNNGCKKIKKEEKFSLLVKAVVRDHSRDSNYCVFVKSSENLTNAQTFSRHSRLNGILKMPDNIALLRISFERVIVPISSEKIHRWISWKSNTPCG